MRGAKDGEAGGLVASSRLDADEPVLYDIDTSYTVSAGDSVGREEQLDWLGDCLPASLDELNGDAVLEVDSEFLWLVRCGDGVDSELPHVLWRCHVWVLEDAGLVGAVGHVLVHAPWLCLCLGDRDADFVGVVEKVVAAGEAVVEFGNAPWGNDLDVGLEGVVAEFEADLIVTFAGATVGDGDAALALGDGDLATGDDGAGEGGA